LLSWSGPDLEKRPVTRRDLGSEVVADLAPALPQPEPEAALPVGMVEYSYYHGNWSKIPSFDALPVVKSARQLLWFQVRCQNFCRDTGCVHLLYHI